VGQRGDTHLLSGDIQSHRVPKIEGSLKGRREKSGAMMSRGGEIVIRKKSRDYPQTRLSCAGNNFFGEETDIFVWEKGGG